MSISSVSATSAVTAMTTAAVAAPDDPTALVAATQTTVSPEGGVFGELASLAQSDPAKFKQVAAEVAQKLKDQAGQATGPEAQVLGKLADRFDEAARTGDVSVLKPGGAQGAQGHHHHRHGSHGAQGAQGSGGGASPMQLLSQLVSTAIQDVGDASSASAS